MPALAAALLLGLIAAVCGPAAAQDLRREVSAAAVPLVVEAREAIQQVVPPVRPSVQALSPASVDLIVRWEITSPSHYERRLRWPVWPGGASGVTWCIGYDGGHQTRTVIRSDWGKHYAVDRLATTAGLTGQAARSALPRYRDIVTPYAECVDVFERITLPAYTRLTQRTFAKGWHLLPPDAQGSLVSTVYNRGASMAASDRRLEMRILRDVCVPAGDTTCMARQYRAMCRHWAGTPNGAGLCARYEDTARLAEGSRR